MDEVFDNNIYGMISGVTGGEGQGTQCPSCGIYWAGQAIVGWRGNGRWEKEERGEEKGEEGNEGGKKGEEASSALPFPF